MDLWILLEIEIKERFPICSWECPPRTTSRELILKQSKICFNCPLPMLESLLKDCIVPVYFDCLKCKFSFSFKENINIIESHWHSQNKQSSVFFFFTFLGAELSQCKRCSEDEAKLRGGKNAFVSDWLSELLVLFSLYRQLSVCGWMKAQLFC